MNNYFNLNFLLLLLIFLQCSKISAQLLNDTIIYINSNEGNYSQAKFINETTCEQCKEALALYKEAFERSMAFDLQDFLPIVNLVTTCEIYHSKCFEEEQSKENIKIIDLYANEFKLVKWRNNDNFKYLKSKKPNEIISEFKAIYEKQLAPSCDECIKLFERYYDAFKKDKFDYNLKLQVQRCRFQILNKAACEKLNTKYNKKSFFYKVNTFALAYPHTGWNKKTNKPIRELEKGKRIMHSSLYNNENEFYKKQQKLVKKGFLTKEYINNWTCDYKGSEKVIYPEKKFDNYYNLELRPKEHISIFKLNDKWGVMSNLGIVFIKPIYDKIKPIKIKETILYLVYINSKYGICNSSGKELMEPIFDEIILNDKDEKLSNLKVYNKDIFYRLNEKYGVISNLDSALSISSAFIDEINFDSNIIKAGDKIGFINKDLTSFIYPKYDTIINKTFKEWSSVLQAGKLISTDTIYHYFTCYKLNNKWGILNNVEGNEITEPKYDEVFPFYNPWNKRIYNYHLGGYEKSANLFLVKVKYNNKWGLIDEKFNQLIENKFDEIRLLENGYVQVKNDFKWGLIDDKGFLMIEPKYDYPFNFVDGKASVGLNGINYKINQREEIIINDFQYSDFSQITIGGLNMRYQIEKKFIELFSNISVNQTFSSILGNEVSTTEMVEDKTYEIQRTVEGWLGGPMTAAQFEEFNLIKKRSASMANFVWNAILSSPVRSEDERKSRNPSAISNIESKACYKCNKEFKFRIWDGGQHSSGGGCWGGWQDIKEKKPGWIKCPNCTGYGLNWDYNGRCPESTACKINCVNGWRKCEQCRGKGVD